MDSHHTSKKKIEKKSNLKRSTSTVNIAKHSKKKGLKPSVSSASLSKNAQTASTFHTTISKSLPKKSTSKKLIKKKKASHDKENIEIKTKQKIKTGKSKKEKMDQLTDRKKIHLEFFMYKDNYLPIQNTEQRKIVYKISLIDERMAASKCLSKRDQMTLTQAIQTNNQATDAPSFFEEEKVQQIQRADSEIQTQPQFRSSQTSDIQSVDNQKCFVSTLSQLQFLYLPDDKNFQGFSPSEKVHYRDLFLFMAKKFEQQKQEFDEATIQFMLSQRQSMQKGITEHSIQKGIPTHTPSILSYLANLFFYIQIHEKIPLIDRINCNYGYSMLQKIDRLRHDLPTKRPSKLISQSTFWAFQQQLHGEIKFESQIMEQSLHYHNKAIFDCVNQFLEYFQPYYSSSGEPFPWNYNFQTTFYCITEQSYNALTCQIKEKVWESCTTLAGIILNIQNQQKYKAHIQKILQNERLMLIKEVKKLDFKVQVEEERTKLLFDISECIEDQLLLEMVKYLVK